MHEFLDIYTIVFIALAIFVIFRLRSVLGQRTGSERPPFDPFRRPEPPKAEGESNVVPLPTANRQAPPAPREEAQPAPVDPDEQLKGIASPDSPLGGSLKAVMAAESGFNPDAVSPKGAVGLMQIMPGTAERYGLSGDGKRPVEEKLRDPKLNIRIGTRYLADLLKLYPRQLHLVLASYNAGEGAVQQYGNTVPPYDETRAYVDWVQALQQAFRSQALMAARGVKVERATVR